MKQQSFKNWLKLHENEVYGMYRDYRVSMDYSPDDAVLLSFMEYALEIYKHGGI